MLDDLTSFQTALVVVLVSFGIYPIGRAAQWLIWRAARWLAIQISGEPAARSVDMAMHPDPRWKQRTGRNSRP